MRSRQVCESGLSVGDTEGKTLGATAVMMATEGAVEGTDTRAVCAVDSAGRLLLGASVMDPWKFRSEVRQQSGNDVEWGGGVVAPLGQHACVWPRHGAQSAFIPESCTRKTASKT